MDSLIFPYLFVYLVIYYPLSHTCNMGHVIYISTLLNTHQVCTSTQLKYNKITYRAIQSSIGFESITISSCFMVIVIGYFIWILFSKDDN
jgi:hypothetical protein